MPIAPANQGEVLPRRTDTLPRRTDTIPHPEATSHPRAVRLFVVFHSWMAFHLPHPEATSTQMLSFQTMVSHCKDNRFDLCVD
jgi:hypothetical protein